MTFYKYKTISNLTLDSISNKYFYYSRQEQLDDPFDMYTPVGILETDEEINELFKRDPELASKYTLNSFKKKQIASEKDEEYHKRFLQVNQMYHVFCLTPHNNNDAMWALYANNYSGIAIGYKVIKEPDNKYSISLGLGRDITNQRQILLPQGKERFYENPDLRIVLFPVNYDISKLKIFTPLCEDYREMLGNMLIKKEIWSFETEYRSVIISPDHMKSDLKIYYPEEVLSEIIFGYRTSEEDIKTIIELVQNNYSNKDDIKFYRAVPNRNKFTIELKEL